jgi:glycosyltransferase involved in cell wall biosynthesis
MKILLITACLPFPPDKGEKIRSMAILENLAELGSVDLVSIGRDKLNSSSKNEIKKYCRKLQIFTINKVKAALKLPLAFFRRKSLSHIYFEITAAKKYLQQLNYNEYDLVFIISGNIYLNIPKQIKPPCYWDLIDLDSNKWLSWSQASKNPLKSWLYKRESELIKQAELTISSFAKRTFVINQNELNIAMKLQHIIKAEVLPASLPKCYPTPESVTKLEQLIVFSGQMDYAPNIAAVKFLHDQVYPLVIKELPQAKVLIVGRNANTKLQKSCSNFSFSGSVLNSANLIAEAAVYTIPIFNPTGQPTKVLEALACKVPIVATKEIGDLYEFKDQEHYLAANTAQEFADNIIAILIQPQKNSNLAVNAFRLIEEARAENRLHNFLKDLS